MELSLAMEVKSDPTKESPAPVVSTAFTANPLTFPLHFCCIILKKFVYHK